MSGTFSADQILAPGSLKSTDKYLCLRFRVDAADESLFVAEMDSLSTLGMEKLAESAGESIYSAYFEVPPAAEVRDLAIGARQIVGARLVDVSPLAEQDWLALYRKRVRPFPLGRRFWIDPREPESATPFTPDNRQLLRIPARTAFGTGSHSSTSLMVRLLEDLPLTGRRVLDVGTGTGIFGMVALYLGAASVIALDIDPVATCIARQTCSLNGLRPRIVAGSVHALRTVESSAAFDIGLANVIPPLLRPDLPLLVNTVKVGGRVLLSGILIEQELTLTEELKILGLRVQSRSQAEGWVALQMEKQPS